MKPKYGSTVYISGPMSGKHNQNAKEFFYWQKVLETSGYDVLNPMEKEVEDWINSGYCLILQPFTEEWEDVIARDCEDIRLYADWLFVLNGHEKSAGATREIETAKLHGIDVFYEEERAV